MSRRRKDIGNMYKHHEESIANMKEYFRKQGAIALILIGSVAKGTERIDSDLDCAVVLSEEEYAEKEKRRKNYYHFILIFGSIITIILSVRLMDI